MERTLSIYKDNGLIYQGHVNEEDVAMVDDSEGAITIRITEPVEAEDVLDVVLPKKRKR